ncbi:replication protein A 32 kDa subunit B-like isoform X5 [Neltuma alba]|uniref:replication protein A 32 kDa subunit B-like isoform X5 n=1 Tax=Neltuma alba TaxID=207710 RepID=UPI0010A4DE6A|nr:replication protein A 32 kDa subunit B-like isoform X5 [Prosopis alba]
MMGLEELQEDVDTNEAEGLRDGMYVRLHGHLKGFQGKRNLNVFSFRLLSDFNEMASHFIDCICAHLYNTRIRFSGQHKGQKSVEDMVLEILRLPSNRAKEEGVSRDLIALHLGLPLDKLMLSIKNLVEEGAIYEAIADHYKSIING